MRIEERFESGRSLKELSTFGIGGPVRHYFSAENIEEIEQALEWSRLHRVPYFILGKGSNCLFDDRGFNGLVIHNRIDFCNIDGNEISAGAGASFSLLGIRSAKNSLSGLEFAAGIPGTVGGAIYMNAGAGGRETADVLLDVVYLLENGDTVTYLRSDFQFGHRTSPFQLMKGCILAARFVMASDSNARQKQMDMLTYRMNTQPLRDQSAGCVFRNPSAEISAGALIDRAGLKGKTIGGAKVSEMHANFIVNIANATQADVCALISEVQNTVFEKSGIWMSPEVCVVPFE